MSKPYKPTKKEIEKKLKEAIIILNETSLVKLAPSQIHGIGVVALRDIKKGEKLYVDSIPHQYDLPYKKFNKLRAELRDLILGQWPLVITGSHFLYPVTRFSAYLNHSDDPNCDAKEDVALKDIAKGEEITEDYRKIEGHEKIFTWLHEKES